MKCLLTFFLFLNLIVLSYVECKISDKRLCVDAECSVPISNAKTILRYNSDDSRILSFIPKQDVTIYSKSAGDREDLWGAEIKGKRGYVPKNLVRETKVYNKPTLTVPTESAKETNIVNETLPIIENSQNEIKLVLKGSFGLSGVSADTVPPAIKPQQANGYEIIDGTTVYEEVKDPTTPQPESEEIINTSKETPPLSVNTENLTIIEDSLTKVEGKPGDENKYTDKVVSNQDSQRIEVTSNEEKDTTSKENIPNESKTQETPTENLKNLDVKTEEEKIAELLMKPVEQGFYDLLYESESSEEDVNEDEDYNETDLTSSEENAVTDKEKDNTPILQISPTGLKNNDFKTDIKDVDVKNTENTMEKEDLPISETVNPAMKYGINDTNLKDKDNVIEKDDLPISETVNPAMKYRINDTNLKDKDNVIEKDDLPISETVNPAMKYDVNDIDLKDKVNVTEEDNLPNFKTPHSPGPVDLKMETPNVPKTEELDTSNNQKGEVMKEETNLAFSEILNVTESVETSTETPTVITKDEMETSKIVENKVIPDSVEDVGQPSMTEDKKAGDETKILETGDLPDELSNNTKDASNFISSTDSSIVENSNSTTASIETQRTVSSADNPKMTEDSSVSGIESPSISSEFKSGETNITDATQDSNIDNNTLVEDTTKPQIETNVDVPSIPLVVDTSIYKTEMTESSITGDQSDIKIQGLNSFDSGISDMQKPEIKNEIDENNDVEENVYINSTEVYDSTESVEQTVEIPSKIETEDEFAAVVEEVTEDTVNIITEDTVVEEGSSGGIFSWFTSLFYGSDIPTNQIEEVSNVVTSHPEEQTENLWKHPSHIEDSQEESCTVTGLGEDTCPKLHQVSKPEVWASSKSSNADFVMMSAVSLMDKIPLEMTLLLVVTSIVVLIFTLGHYYIEAHRRDGSLVARINQLERDLLVKKKENSILEDAWSTAQFEVKGRDCEVSEIKETNEELLLELEELKALRSDLEEQITSLEKELETATESGLEMHRLFSESLSTQDGSQVLLQTVESLREKLDKQDTQIALLNRSLGEKNEEIEMLQDQMSNAEEESKTLKEKLNRLRREKEEEELEIKEKHRALIVQLEEVVETKALEESRMSMEMSKLRISLEEMQRKLIEREAEVDAMKDSVRQLRATDQEESLQELYDVAAVSAKLTTAIGERDEFREKFIEEEGARKLLEDHVRVISREVAELKENFEAAEKEKIEALTKLKVLSNYFKEKETELQKELGSQESMWLQKQGDDHTIYEQMRSLREENDKFNGDSIITLREVETKCKKMTNGKITPKLRPKGLQNESLKKEICEQESSFKIQLANVEQRAHENWVASRQAERRLKEIQQEATQLRNRLTLSEKNAANHEDPKQKINDTNGELSSPPPALMFSPTTSPPFMMYHGMGHIPPSDFIPPPPLVSPFSPDSRPPPLGRISSPPLDPRFSPPPPMPFSHPYDYSYGHHSPSPPLPLPHRTVHKPQPREAGRDPKDIQLPPPALGLIFEPPPPYLCSPSPPHRSNNTFANTVTSNYSVDSTDKPIRRGKR